MEANYATPAWDFSELDGLSDFELVRQALRNYRRVTGMFRHGGMGREHELAKRALDALDRIEQPRLFQAGGTGDDGASETSGT